MSGLHVWPLTGLPEITAGADLAALLLDALTEHGGLQDGDVVVVSSKLVSKAHGLRRAGLDPELPDQSLRERAVRDQTVRVVAERRSPGGLTQIVESVAGPVLAAAGVDASNTGDAGGVLLLPDDPDAAARSVHEALQARSSARFGVVLSDTAGRPWRQGQTDFALGAHGVRALDDLRGGTDADGRPLAVTARAVADEIAAAADLVKGKSTGIGAALLRGLDLDDPQDLLGAASLVRTGPGDWFALGHREAVRAALGAPPGSDAADRVGIAPVGPDAVADRAGRALRLALLGHEDAALTGSPDTGFIVHATDPVLAGRVAARLEIALAGEDLVCEVEVGDRRPEVESPVSDH